MCLSCAGVEGAYYRNFRGIEEIVVDPAAGQMIHAILYIVSFAIISKDWAKGFIYDLGRQCQGVNKRIMIYVGEI